MNDNEYVRRVRAMESRLFRVAQAMLWRYADSADAVQEAVFGGWLKKGSLRAFKHAGGNVDIRTVRDAGDVDGRGYGRLIGIEEWTKGRGKYACGEGVPEHAGKLIG